MAEKQAAVKVTLDNGKTKKVVILREMKISDTESAAELVSVRAHGDAILMQIFMQKELLKLLLLQIDGKDVPHHDREQLDKLFTVSEYNKLLKVVGKLAGVDEKGESQPQLEMLSIGGN